MCLEPPGAAGSGVTARRARLGVKNCFAKHALRPRGPFGLGLRGRLGGARRRAICFALGFSRATFISAVSSAKVSAHLLELQFLRLLQGPDGALLSRRSSCSRTSVLTFKVVVFLFERVGSSLELRVGLKRSRSRPSGRALPVLQRRSYRFVPRRFHFFALLAVEQAHRRGAERRGHDNPGLGQREPRRREQ